MRKYLVLSLLGLICLPLFAQKIPEFGKVEKEELLMKECDFDKAAEAVVLFDVAEVYCSFFPISYGNPVASEVKRHVRIKILKDKGLDHANIHLPYYSFNDAEKIRSISAQTYNLDASGNVIITKIDKKNIYDKKINKRFSEQIFTFPEVKAGSVIEYEFTRKSEGLASLENWYFQRSIPVKHSEYVINFPTEFQVNATPFCSYPYKNDFSQKKDRDIQTYVMENVPGLPDEPFTTTKKDYLQHLEPRIVAVNYQGTRLAIEKQWPAVIKSLMEDEDFGVQLKKEIPRTKDLDDELKKLTDPFQKMATIYYYVRNNMQWNGFDNIWALDGVKAAWKDKKGTTGEINLILVNLLKDAGFQASPILVSTKENGRVNATVPVISQFDKVMAYVKLNGKTHILDATNKLTPAHLIPLEVMYSEGLVIEKPLTFEWGWRDIWDENLLYKNFVSIVGEVKESGVLTGNAYVNSMDYERVSRTENLKDGKDKFVTSYFTSTNPGVVIDSFTLKNETTDSLPLEQYFKFTMPIASSGEYKYFTLNLFTGFEKNIFVSDDRFTDVFFGANQHYVMVGSFTIPDNYTFDELPKNIKMIMPDTSIVFSRRFSVSGNQLMSNITIDFKKPVFSPDEYPYFMEFYKKLFDMLNEQIVLKKKS